jgi:hypothetical protein
MRIIDSLSVPFFEFKCEAALVDEVLLELKNQEFLPHSNFVDSTVNESNKTVELTNAFYNKKLMTWFEECLEQVRKLYFIDTIKLEITNCWATKNNLFSKHHLHNHNQSLAGGIFYLDDADSAETVFYSPNPWQRYHNDQIMNIADEKLIEKNLLATKIKQEKGKLVLFPPHVMHGTLPNKKMKSRYVIAFDAFFSGRIYDNARWPYFEIKTTSIHDSHIKQEK